MIEDIGAITEPVAFEQLGIAIIDKSRSMGSEGETGQPKSSEVNMGERSTVSRLKVSRNRAHYWWTRIGFAESAEVILRPTAITELDEIEGFEPIEPTGKLTAIGDGLHVGRMVAEEWLAQPTEVPRSVVLMLLTDGQSNTGRDPLAVAQEIKSSGLKIKICAAGYGKDSDIDTKLLQQIVSEPMGFVRAYDPETLRKWFEASISRVRG